MAEIKPISAVGHNQKLVAEEPVTSVLPSRGIPVFDRELTADEEGLAALGYRPEFRRELTTWTTFCVSFAVLGLLPSFASTLYFGMGFAGTPGMVWGWLIAIFFILCIAMSMAELCSSMPTSGGLYYASAVLAPPGWGPLAAWITGWSNWLGLVNIAPSANYTVASMILAVVSINQPTYIPQSWHVWLLTTLIMLSHACISSMPTKWIGQLNSFGSTFNIIALFVVIILIPAGTNREEQGLSRFTQSSEVWGNIYKGTSFPAGVAVLMSFVGVIWTMAGYDSAFHLSEECSNANIAAPRAIVLTAATGGVFGWLLQLVVAYTVIDIPSVFKSSLGQPFAAYLLQVLPQRTATAILALTIMSGYSMGQAGMVAASRVTFAYARDGCFPGSSIWSKVNRRTMTPVNAVWFNTTIGICLTLLVFAGPVAIAAMFSIAALACLVAFIIPVFIRVVFVGDKFRAGPWNLGRWSRPIGSMACSFVAVMVPILCLPSHTGADLDASLMNWTCLVYGGPMTAILIWWMVSARKWFKGPKINIEHYMIGRGHNVLDGSEDSAGSGDSSAGSIIKDIQTFDDKKAANMA